MDSYLQFWLMQHGAESVALPIEKNAMKTTQIQLKTGSGDLVNLVQMPSTHGHYIGRRGGEIRGIVIHTAESQELPIMAENLGSWLAGTNPPERAGWHIAVDNNSCVQSVSFADAAWHSGACDLYTIGIEHAGRASQSVAEWHDVYSTDMLNLSAKLVACLCKLYQIPIRRPSSEEIRTQHKKGGARGIWGHVDVTKSGLGGTHTDPGQNFPWDEYLARVRAYMR